MGAFLAPVVLAPGGSLLRFEWKICLRSSSAEKANIPALLSRRRDPLAVKTKVNTPALLSRQRDPSAVKNRANMPALISRRRTPIALEIMVCTPAPLSLCGTDSVAVEGRRRLALACSRLWKKRRGMEVGYGLLHQSGTATVQEEPFANSEMLLFCTTVTELH